MREHALALLRQALANPGAEFRPHQWEAIEKVVAGRGRVLLVQRTGWGKSWVYFLATKLLRDRGAGPTLLVSPLLSLIRNQLEAASRIGIRAATIHSGNAAEWEEVYAQLVADAVDLLLVAPERFGNPDFQEHALAHIARRVALLVVDEAHCISDWGHDFRPDYRRLTRVLQALPQTVAVLATTATATNRVIVDVLTQLGPGLQLVRGPLTRESLRLQTLRLPSQAQRLAWLAHVLPTLPGTGVIYTLTKRDAARVAAWLRSRGLEAQEYYGPLDPEARVTLEQKLLANQVKALVATSALGMGFDKPDLAFVIHFQRPASVIHYYQQVGRAGRAIENAYGVLLAGDEDDEIAEYFLRTAHPPAAHVTEVLAALEAAPDGLSLGGLMKALNLSRAHVEKVLRLLASESPSPVTRLARTWHRTPVRYRTNEAQVEQLVALRREEQARMEEYLGARDCLMAFLARELNDPDPRPCGRCASCEGRPLLPEQPPPETLREAEVFPGQFGDVIEPRQRWPAGVEAPGFRGMLGEELRAEPGRALCLWGDAGLGRLVRRGKQQDGRFCDELVEAAAELVQGRWGPSLSWLTCVPSHANPMLVPDLARRLARRLNLPFVECVRKVRPSAPQKNMRNSQWQVQNLLGTLHVEAAQVRPDPVLLVDDIVHSGWTFAMVTALLRAAGSGPVFPLALCRLNLGQSD